MSTDSLSLFIRGERISLRPLLRENLPLYVNWVNNEKNRPYIPYQVPTSLKTREEWMIAVEGGGSNPNKIIFEIYLHKENMPIDYIQLHDIAWIHKRAEIGILIGENEYWGQGYGSESVELIIKYAFGELNFRKLKAVIAAKNKPSQRVFKKVGFSLETVLKQEDYYLGEYVDMFIFSRYSDS